MSIERSETASPISLPGAEPPPAAPSPSRSLIRQAYHDTLSTKSARVGLAWLFLLAFFAVFAPLLATSHPYIMQTNGRWSSPVLNHLAPADVLFLVATAAIIVLAAWRRYSFLESTGIVMITVAIAATPIYYLVRPPEAVDYSEYREGIASGKIRHAVFAPIPYSPQDRLRDQPQARLTPPGFGHWVGTDTNGADVLSLLLHGCRIALSIGLIATSISVVIGIIIGGIMGYYVGVVDLLGMRLIEIFESIPTLMLLISITAFIKHRNIYLMMVVIGATGWTSYARFIRADFFTIRNLDYVHAAVAAGLPKRLILFRHMLANAMTPILVNTTFGVASAILYESVLSFLGLGLIDEASWGSMLQQARAGGAGFILWLMIPPGAAIFLAVFAYNLVGEAIRDALDPKLRKRD